MFRQSVEETCQTMFGVRSRSSPALFLGAVSTANASAPERFPEPLRGDDSRCRKQEEDNRFEGGDET